MASSCISPIWFNLSFFRRGKLHGIVVYTPVPEVSMMDLTVHVEHENSDLYNSVCDVMLRNSLGPLKSVLKYVKKMGDETRYLTLIKSLNNLLKL